MSTGKIKCPHCNSEDIFPYAASPDPKKIAYRCRKCTTSWRDA